MIPELITWTSLFFIGYVAIYFFADIIIDTLEDFSKVFRVSPVIAGIFILGIDLEESSVSLLAAFNQLPYISIGNLIGNTIIATTLVFGLPVLFYRVNFKQLPYFYYIVIIVSAISITIATAFPQFLSIFAFFNLAMFALYSLKSVKVQRDYREQLSQGKLNEEEIDGDDDDDDSLKGTIIVKVVLALIAIFIGGEILLASAEQIMALTSLSETFFGLIIMAYVTNVEEIFIIFKSIKKQRIELGLSAEIGKILWNITLIYGISGLLIVQFAFEPIMLMSSMIFLAMSAILVINLLTDSFSMKTGIFYLSVLVFYVLMNVFFLL
ncbi:MAG: sodium:calcium antiporter [Candidatus Odinarchaeota archaeon]